MCTDFWNTLIQNLKLSIGSIESLYFGGDLTIYAEKDIDIKSITISADNFDIAQQIINTIKELALSQNALYVEKHIKNCTTVTTTIVDNTYVISVILCDADVNATTIKLYGEELHINSKYVYVVWQLIYYYIMQQLVTIGEENDIEQFSDILNANSFPLSILIDYYNSIVYSLKFTTEIMQAWYAFDGNITVNTFASGFFSKFTDNYGIWDPDKKAWVM